MSVRKNKIYALLSKKQNSEPTIDMSKLAIDEMIKGEQVTKNILKRLKAKDTLVVENIQYLGQSVSEIVETLNEIAQFNVNLCLAQENMTFQADKLQEIASSLLIAVRLHQSLISLRSKTALQDRKSKGLTLGRPLGSTPGLKLDDHKAEIQKMLLTGMSKDDIAEKFNVCRATVYNYVRKNPELLSGEVL